MQPEPPEQAVLSRIGAILKGDKLLAWNAGAGVIMMVSGHGVGAATGSIVRNVSCFGHTMMSYAKINASLRAAAASGAVAVVSSNSSTTSPRPFSINAARTLSTGFMV